MMSSAMGVFAALPAPTLFQLPPAAAPAPIPPPSAALSASPLVFDIPDRIYHAALDPRVPLTIAAVYAVTAKSLSVYNQSRGRKPWAISQTRGFFAFVVLHNVFLAVYSAWTFWGMLGGMIRSISSPAGPQGLAGTVDSLCGLHGGAGLGNAALYDDRAGRWTSWAGAESLAGGVPSSAATGRIWNEGLAFYGWLFYLSKFYEVLDTFIILAKGKPSSVLQTYHHAGAMLCMWAGIRYMSAPIWLFVVYNSGIHAMMYTYYTVTAFNIRVPTAIKRSLTTMQITQFLLGATYAMAHSFLSYTVPVPLTATGSGVGGTTAETLRRVALAAESKVANASAAQQQQQPYQTAEAAGQTVLVTQPCINTAGETFAIWLNVLYLAPLTYLFVKFFIASYLRRSNAEQSKLRRPKGAKDASMRRASNVTLAEKAGWDAAKATQREVYADPNEEATEDSPSGSSS